MEDDAVVLKRALTEYGDYEEDVIAEILARLPVKSLVRFRCVCKSWRALISAPYFVKKHFSWQAESSKLIFDIDPPLFLDLKALKDVKTGDDVQFAVTQLEFPVSETILDPDYREVVGSCNGLVCLEIDFKAIMLWNPYTRDSKVLPTPPGVIKKSYDSSYEFYGLGYDSATDDYKVILGFTYDDADGARKIMVHICALKTGLWKTVQDIEYVWLQTWEGLFVNGALHWLYVSLEGKLRILSFDLGEEKFQKTIPLPYDDGWFSDPLIHRNCLCVCTHPTESASIHIWMMKEYGVKESWTELVQFSLDNYALGPGIYRQNLKAVCVLENGVVLIEQTDDSECLVVFSNLKEKKFEHCVQISQGYVSTAVIYREMLVSPGYHTYTEPTM